MKLSEEASETKSFSVCDVMLDDASLGDSYIFYNLCKSLGLTMYSTFDDYDYELVIKACGSQDSIDKLNKIWYNLDFDSINNKLGELLQVDFEKSINDK